MKVDLSDDLADFVAERIRAGGYTNQSEVLMASLDRGHAENVAGKRQLLTDNALRDIAQRGRRIADRRAARKR